MYGAMMREIGWQIEGKSGSKIFYKSLGPLSIAKIQRPKSIDINWLNDFRKKHHTLTTYIEPSLTSTLPTKFGFFVEPFAHSCTSLIDLSGNEQFILNSFTQKTRYNITHTLSKKEVSVATTNLANLSRDQKESFFALHKEWSRKKSVVGYPTSLLNAVIKSYGKNGDLHMCYQGEELIGSLLMLYHDSVATYYAAFSTQKGYKSFAPTLLTWTAIQKAKSLNCEIFDFGGIYDPRYPKMYRGWVGFTKFKSGFNPTVVSYPPTSLQLF